MPLFAQVDQEEGEAATALAVACAALESGTSHAAQLSLLAGPSRNLLLQPAATAAAAAPNGGATAAPAANGAMDAGEGAVVAAAAAAEGEEGAVLVPWLGVHDPRPYGQLPAAAFGEEADVRAVLPATEGEAAAGGGGGEGVDEERATMLQLAAQVRGARGFAACWRLLLFFVLPGGAGCGEHWRAGAWARVRSARTSHATWGCRCT